jgi:TP901 family phage tail tape measure protein
MNATEYVLKGTVTGVPKMREFSSALLDIGAAGELLKGLNLGGKLDADRTALEAFGKTAREAADDTERLLKTASRQPSIKTPNAPNPNAGLNTNAPSSSPARDSANVFLAEAERLRQEAKAVSNEIANTRLAFQSLPGKATAAEITALREAMTPLIAKADALKVGLQGDSSELKILNLATANAHRSVTVAEGGISRLGLASQVSAGIIESDLVSSLAALVPGGEEATSILSDLASGGLTPVGAAAAAAGVAVSAAVVYVKNAVDVAATFEQKMSGVNAVLNGTPAQLQALTDKALELGSKTVFSASQAAEGLENLAKNGVSFGKIMAGAGQATLDLASATGTELPESADIMSDALANFEKQGVTYKQIVNGITGVTVASKFSANDYALALAQGGGVAALNGVKFNDFNAVIASTSSLFKSGSDAGTSYKTFIQRLVPTTNTAAGAMYNMGLLTGEASKEFGKNALKILDLEKAYKTGTISKKDFTAQMKALAKEQKALSGEMKTEESAFYKSNGQLKDAATIAGNLKAATEKLTPQLKNLYLTQAFGTDAMRTAGGLAEKGAEGVNKFSAAIAKTDAGEQAKKRLENYKGATEQVGGALETLSITIGSALLPGLTMGAKGFAEMINGVTKFVTPLAQQAGPAIKAFIGDAMKLGSQLAPIFKIALPIIGFVIEGMTAKIRGIIQVISGVITTVTALFKGNWAGAWEGFKTVLSGALLIALSSLGGWAAKFGGKLLSSAAGWIGQFVPMGTRLVSGFVGSMASQASTIIAVMSKIGGMILGPIGGVIGKMVGAGRDLILGFVKGITGNIGAIGGAIAGMAESTIKNVRDKFGWNSPMKLSEGMGKDYVGGWVKGMKDLSPLEREAVRLRTTLIEATRVGDITGIVRLRTEIEAFKRTSSSAKDTMQAVTQAMPLHAKAHADTSAMVGKHAKAHNNLEAAQKGAREEQRRLTDEIVRARDELAKNIAEAQIGDGVQKTISAVERSEGAFTSYQDGLNKLFKTGVTLTVPMLDALKARFDALAKAGADAADAQKGALEKYENDLKGFRAAEKSGNDERAATAAENVAREERDLQTRIAQWQQHGNTRKAQDEKDAAYAKFLSDEQLKRDTAMTEAMNRSHDLRVQADKDANAKLLSQQREASNSKLEGRAQDNAKLADAEAKLTEQYRQYSASRIAALASEGEDRIRALEAVRAVMLEAMQTERDYALAIAGTTVQMGRNRQAMLERDNVDAGGMIANLKAEAEEINAALASIAWNDPNGRALQTEYLGRLGEVQTKLKELRAVLIQTATAGQANPFLNGIVKGGQAVVDVLSGVSSVVDGNYQSLSQLEDAATKAKDALEAIKLGKMIATADQIAALEKYIELLGKLQARAGGTASGTVATPGATRRNDDRRNGQAEAQSTLERAAAYEKLNAELERNAQIGLDDIASFEALTIAQDALGQAMGETGPKYATAILGLEGLKRKYPELAEQIDEMIAKYNQLEASFAQSNGVEKAQSQVSLYKTALQDGLISQDEYRASVEALMESLEAKANAESTSGDESERLRLEIEKLQLELDGIALAEYAAGWERVKDQLLGVASLFSTLGGSNASSAGGKIASQVSGVIESAVSLAAAAATGNIMGIVQGVVGLFSKFSGALDPMLKALEPLGPALESIGSIFGASMKATAPFVELVANAFSMLAPLLEGIIVPVFNVVGDVVKFFANVIVDIVNGLSGLVKTITFGAIDLGKMKKIGERDPVTTVGGGEKSNEKKAAPEGSINALEERISKLREEYGNAQNDVDRANLMLQIQSLEAEIKRLKGEASEAKAEAGSIAALEAEKSALQTKYQNTASETERETYLGQINALEARIKTLKGEKVETKTPDTKTTETPKRNVIGGSYATVTSMVAQVPETFWNPVTEHLVKIEKGLHQIHSLPSGVISTITAPLEAFNAGLNSTMSRFDTSVSRFDAAAFRIEAASYTQERAARDFRGGVSDLIANGIEAYVIDSRPNPLATAVYAR